VSGFDAVLDQVRSWPVPNAAAAVVSADGVLATVGDTALPYYLASVTKPLAALATLVAVEEGALELTTPADPALVPGATLRHLLAHTAGLAFDRPQRVAAPETRRVYSNVGLEIAGDLVAEAVGMPFGAYLDEAVCRPLGLSGTTLDGSPAKDATSTVADLARVLHEMLSPSGLLHPSTLADLRSVQWPGLRGVVPGYGMQDPCDWGLGWEIRGHKNPHWTGRTNSPGTYGHFGQSGTMMWVDPVAGIGVVALADIPFEDWAKQGWPALSDAVLAQAAG
jgi:CubicO group peptidase (beta-lactamase class C family)